MSCFVDNRVSRRAVSEQMPEWIFVRMAFVLLVRVIAALNTE